MKFVKIICVVCGKSRKAILGTQRHKQKVCGECWDWDSDED